MTKTKKILKASVAIVFVYGLTVIGVRIEEPVLGLLALGIVWLYFKADFSK